MSKEIDLIIDNIRSLALINFLDGDIYEDKEERLRRYYRLSETNIRIKNYTNYYSKVEHY